MDAVGVQALADALGAGHEAGQGRVGGNDVGGSDGFVLVEAPGMEFVDGDDARDLVGRGA